MLWLHRFGSLPYFYRVSRPIALALAVPGVQEVEKRLQACEQRKKNFTRADVA